MSFELGKSDISTITGKVDVFQPTGTGMKKKVAVLKVTTKVLPRSEFLELTQSAENDLAIVKALVQNIEPGDSNTQVPQFAAELLDDVFEIEWQFSPILEFVLQSNSERMGRAIRAKN